MVNAENYEICNSPRYEDIYFFVQIYLIINAMHFGKLF